MFSKKEYAALLFLYFAISGTHYVVTSIMTKDFRPAIINSLAYGYDHKIEKAGWVLRWIVIKFGPLFLLTLGYVYDYSKYFRIHT